jgi:hypothetical protein
LLLELVFAIWVHKIFAKQLVVIFSFVVTHLFWLITF